VEGKDTEAEGCQNCPQGQYGKEAGKDNLAEGCESLYENIWCITETPPNNGSYVLINSCALIPMCEAETSICVPGNKTLEIEGLHHSGELPTISRKSSSVKHRFFKVEGTLVIRKIKLYGGKVTGDGGILIGTSTSKFYAFDSILASGYGHRAGCFRSSGFVLLQRSTISNCRSADGYGGFLMGYSGGHIIVQDSIITKNHGSYGCANGCRASTCIFANTLITDNSNGGIWSDRGGGGICLQNSATLYFVNKTVLANNENKQNGKNERDGVYIYSGGGTLDTDGTCMTTLPCLPGTYGARTPATILTPQNAGYQPSSSGTCTICPPGRFSADLNSNECDLWQVCASNEYAETNGTASSDRVCARKCGKEMFLSAVDQTCKRWKNCSEGSYASQNGTTENDRACSICANGQFSNTGNAYHCTTCGKNFIQTIAGKMNCSPCPPGHHTNVLSNQYKTAHDEATDCIPSKFIIQLVPSNTLLGGTKFSVSITGDQANIFSNQSNETLIHINDVAANNAGKIVSQNQKQISKIQVPTSRICAQEMCEMWTSVVVKDMVYNATAELAVYYIEKACPSKSFCSSTVTQALEYRRAECQFRTENQKCENCPFGARCPGGKQVWALPTFGTYRGMAGMQIKRCEYPHHRCLGFVESAQQELCGLGYGGLLCGGCMPEYYNRAVGPKTCFPCPDGNIRSSSFVASILLPLLYFVAIMFVFAMFAFAVSYVVVKRLGGTVMGGIKRSFSFLTYTCLSLSLLAQVSRKAHGNLPEYMQAVAQYLALFQLEISGPVAPECTEYPFLKQNLIFALSTICTLCIIGAVAGYTSKSNCGKFYFEKFAHAATVWLCLSYAISTNLAFATIHCVRQQEIGTVMANNPLITCFEGSHTFSFVWAVLSLATHSLVFPLFTFLKLIEAGRSHEYLVKKKKANIRRTRHAFPTLNGNSALLQQGEPEYYDKCVLKYFLRNEFSPNQFYFRHLELMTLFIGAISNEYLFPNSVLAYAFTFAIVLCGNALLYAIKKPFKQEDAWKLPVRIYLSICAICNVILNSFASSTDKDDQRTLSWLAPVAFTLNVFLIPWLLCAYGYILVAGAAKEESDSKKILTRIKSETREWSHNPSYKDTPRLASTVSKQRQKKETYELHTYELVAIGTKGMPPLDQSAPQDYETQTEWYQHYDSHSGDLYFECVNSVITWKEPNSKKSCKVHRDASSGKVYYEVKKRRVTWTKPLGVDIIIESEAPKLRTNNSPTNNGSQQNASKCENTLAEARKRLKCINKNRLIIPENIKTVGAWWELIDENGRTCYLNTAIDKVIYTLPKGWVKAMAKDRFSGRSDHTKASSTRTSASV
jgi:hypothetical protein